MLRAGSASAVDLHAQCTSETQRSAMKLIMNPLFDNGMGILIMFNMVMIIVETDYSVDHDDSLVWIDVFGWLILIIFVIELVLRVYVLRWIFFQDKANTLDFMIVAIDTFFTFLGLIFGNVFPVSVLRIFRLGKLARVSKVFRIFPELRIMMAGLMGSMRSIFWGAVLLAFFLIVWSIIAVQFIHPMNKTLTEEGYHQDCERCHRAYRSVMEAALTFCQQIVAGDSWGEATIPVIEHYPITAFYFMGVFLSVGMAVLNLILGVVVSVAQQEHERLKEEMQDEKRAIEMEVHSHLLDICKEMDLDGNGELSKEEIVAGYRDRADFKGVFEELDLAEDDMPIVWNLLDADKSGAVSYTEFVQQVYKLKTKDTHFMLAHIKYYITKINDAINESNQNIKSQMNIQQAELVELEKAQLTVLEQEQAQLDGLGKDPSRFSPRGFETPVSESHVSHRSFPALEMQNEASAVESVRKPPSTDDAMPKAPVQSCNGGPDGAAKPPDGACREALESKAPGASAEVMNSFLEAFRPIQRQLEDTMLELKQSYDLHELNTMRMLTERLPLKGTEPRIDARIDDLMTVPIGRSPPKERRDDLLTMPHTISLPHCCNRGPAVARLVVPPDDATPGPPLSSADN